MEYITKTIIFLFVLLIGYSTVQYFRTRHFINIGVDLADKAAPLLFERTLAHPVATSLHIGDSSVVGTGSESPFLSVAGRFAADYPRVDIMNLGVNGSKTKDLMSRFEGIQDQRFDIIVMHIGGNDIVRYTDLIELEESLRVVLDLATNISDTVILLHGGDVGTAKLFPYGTRWLFTRRTKQERNIFMPVAKEKGVYYVDLFRRGEDDPFFTDPDKYYAKDNFHPSAEGYRDWYEHVVNVIDTTSFTLPRK